MMKKLRDLLYDMNDIFVALLIVAVAAFVIMGRMDAILSYPATLAANVENVPQIEEPVRYHVSEEDGTEDGENGDGTAGADESQQGEGSNSRNGGGTIGGQSSGAGQHTETPATTISVSIAPGSTASKIADVLVSAGLFENSQQFYNAVSAANADTKLKAGEFLIPSNATPAEVVAILVK